MLPRLIVLDMNMPQLDGRETLVALKKESSLSSIPVVILTTSSSDLDRAFCNHYTVEILTKPRSLKQLQETVE